MKAWWKHDCLVAALLILVIAGIGYGFLWRQGEILYSPHSDVITTGLGQKTVLYKALHEGRGIPFWRTDQLAGYSAFTHPQALYTYPLHFLFYFLEPANAVGGTLWLHFVAAAWVLYMVGAVLGLGIWARLLMAVSAMFNFKLVIAAYTGWLQAIPSITCFPLLFAATFYLVNQRGLRGTLAFCGAVAFCVHTGHFQLAYYTTWFLAVYLLVQAVIWWRTGQSQILRQVALRFLWGAMLGTGMVAYLLIPLVGEVPLISRTEAPLAYFSSNHALILRDLLTFLHPEAIGSPLDPRAQLELWEHVGYFGLLQVILAIFGAVWGWRRHPHTRFFVISFLISMIAAMDSPLIRLFYYVLPGFKLFRCPSRFLFLTAFFGITLAGIGLEETISRLRKRFRWRLLVPVFTGLLLLVISGEGIFYVRRYLTNVQHQEVLPTTDYQKFLASDDTIFRIATRHRATVNYGWAASMDLQMISGCDPYNFSHYQAYCDLLEWGEIRPREAHAWIDLTRLSRGDLLDALNVKYLISPWPETSHDGRFEQVGHWENQPVFEFYYGMVRSDIYVYRNNHFLPRAFWVNELVEVEDEEQMIALMKRKQISHTAIVLGTTQRLFSCGISHEDQVEVLEAYGGYLVLQTQNLARRFLTISEIWHPGWRAFIDGEELKLHRTDVALMGAWIPPGKHRIELRFRPLYWRVAVVITAVSGAIFLFLFSVLWLKRRQATSERVV
jgi:hypothetical protein